MQSDHKLTGEAVALAREHEDVLARLPATVQAFILGELGKWPMLFAPEQRYQRALLEHLSALAPSELTRTASGIARIEAGAGIHRLSRRNPARLQEDAQALLRKQRLVTAWRQEVDAFFQAIDPAINAQLHPPDAPRRLIVQLYASSIAVQVDRLWSRFKETGLRIPLDLEGRRGTGAFLRALFGQPAHDAAGPALFDAARAENLSPLDCWLIESHDALHELSMTGTRAASYTPHPSPATLERAPSGLTGLSYDRLRTYRDELMQALYKKILSGVESPQAFAAYARSLTIAPSSDALLASSDGVRTLVRDVFLTGNGTLFVNNTFVEWAAVQALRRAQPRLLVTRFGVRDRLKPFSSLLLFSQPRPSDQIPFIEDPVGSFVDVEQLSYYVWLNAEKSAAYRNKTLYLFLAEGIDQMLAIRSDSPRGAAGTVESATLADVHATMAHWLKLPGEIDKGVPIPALVA